MDPTVDGDCVHHDAPSVLLSIAGKPRDLGGFSVRRLLPSVQRRMIGPFVFYDHMGPAHMAVGQGMDVRPHPHIALATVTYLFDGEIDHKDSLGSDQTIRPGDVNWMLAGSGIAHSERSSPASRIEGVRIHGIQSWVALPTAHEEAPASFEHHPAKTIPRLERPGAVLDVIAGTAYGAASPVGVLSPTLYVHVKLEAGARLPMDDTHEERAVYVVEGSLGCDGQPFPAGTLVVLRPGARVVLSTTEPTRLMLLGGAKLDGERCLWWNFVSSDKARIERAKDDWKNDRFPKVPGDAERIPLPE
ncbi:MAG: pirin [Labilithrix sp.]|nr:pirin [Labilithrix sp.]